MVNFHAEHTEIYIWLDAIANDEFDGYLITEKLHLWRGGNSGADRIKYPSIMSSGGSSESLEFFATITSVGKVGSDMK